LTLAGRWAARPGRNSNISQISSALFSPEEGSSGACDHAAGEPHRAGEWCGAVIEVENHLLAEYAVAHYLEQPRVTDAYMDERWEG